MRLISLLATMCSTAIALEHYEHSLTTNMIDKILLVLSSDCRKEMESALDSQAKMSIRCKTEIAEAIPQFLSPTDRELYQTEITKSARISEDAKNQKSSSQRNENRKKIQMEENAQKGGADLLLILGSITVSIIGIFFCYAASSKSEQKSESGSSISSTQKRIGKHKVS